MDEIPPANTNDTALYELCLRLTTNPVDPRVQEPQLFVGQLPANLAFAVPVPEGATVLGSLVRGPEHTDIVLDTDLAPQETITFYRERMTAVGWSVLDEQEMMRMHGGFTHSRAQALQNALTFCLDDSSLGLRVQVFPGKGMHSDVRLSLMSGGMSPCSPGQRMQRRHAMRIGVYGVLPSLQPPVQAYQQRNGGGGSGHSDAYTAATLEADGDIHQFAAHYAEQLRQVGWSQEAEGGDEHVMWHTWSFKDDENASWHAIFLILKDPGRRNTYALYLRTSVDEGPQGQSSWFSTTILGG